MHHWTAEADKQEPVLTDRTNKEEAINLSRQQRQSDELYGLHNFIVLDGLLKRHLNLQ